MLPRGCEAEALQVCCVTPSRPRLFFICGSLNQTTPLHQIARQLPECDSAVSPFYGTRAVRKMRELGLLENTIGGNKLGQRCLEYLRRTGLEVDLDGVRGGYDLVVNCTDVTLPENVAGLPLVVVQEGITDPDNLFFSLVRRLPNAVPRWLAGTAATGLADVRFSKTGCDVTSAAVRLARASPVASACSAVATTAGTTGTSARRLATPECPHPRAS